MKQTMKRFGAVLLSLAIMLTAVNTDFISVWAEAGTGDSPYFTFESYTRGDSEEKFNEIRGTVGQYEAVIDGTEFTNYGLSSSAGGAATAACGIDSCNGIINGNGAGGFQAKINKDIVAMVVDLNRVRSISVLQLSWEAASAQTYAIDFSLDGEKWSTVAYVEECTKSGSRCDQITLKTPQNTRYVRMQGLKRSLSYAYNLYEIGIFSPSGAADGGEFVPVYTYTPEQQAAIDNFVKEAEEEAKKQAEWEAAQAELSKYVDTDTNIAKGSAAYTSSYFGNDGNKEGKLDYLTDGDITNKATTAKISKTNPTECFVLDLGQEYTEKDIDKIFIRYSDNSDTWGKEGFTLYVANQIDITTKPASDKDADKPVIDVDQTDWEILYEEKNGENCENQNYYQSFSTEYQDSFRYLKLEYTYQTKERPYGIQIKEFALYAPVEEPEPVKPPVGEPDEPDEPEKRPVTEPAKIDPASTVDFVEYEYKYRDAGYAAGTISISTTEDGTYTLYWGTGDDTEGYQALTRNQVPYTELGIIESENDTGSYQVISDYTAIPYEAEKLLVFNEENDLEYVYEIPEDKQFGEKESKFTFASIGDVHYNRYTVDGKDAALFAFDQALNFINKQGIRFVGGVGDISSTSEKSAFTKFKEAEGDYPDLTVFTCIGNHDCVTLGKDDGQQHFQRYINQKAYKLKGQDTEVQKANGVLNIAENGMDFVYCPAGTGEIFIFLNQNEDETNAYTQSYNILYDTQLDWLDEQLQKYAAHNVYIYFHTYLSTDDKSTSKCVGNLKNPGGYSYNLTYDVNAADGERLRGIINKYDNVTVLNGHSHWEYDMQIFNQSLNIGTTSGEPFHEGATIVHVSSVTSPRSIGTDDKNRTELHGLASEGTFTDVYDDCKIYTGVDFWNGEYEAYATYIDPIGSVPQEDDGTGSRPIELEDAQLSVSSGENNTVTVSWTETQEQEANNQTYNIYINGVKEKANVPAGTYTFTCSAGMVTVKVVPCLDGITGRGISKKIEVKAHEASYTVNYYLQNVAGNDYVLEDTEEESGEVGKTVSVEPSEFPGFTFNASRSEISGKIAEDGSLVLNIFYDRNVYHVRYELNGGTDNPAGNSETYVYGEGLAELDAPSREGYTFDGWYEDEEFGGESVTQIAKDRTGDVTLYAKWKENDKDGTSANYTILYYEQNTEKNGYRLADRSVKTGTVGDSVTAEEIERTGFHYNASAVGSKASGTITEDNRLELALYYDRNTYNITYELDGGTNNSLNSPTYLYGQTMFLEDPAREGYIFDGWYEDEAHTTRIRFICPGLYGDVTVYAAWELEKSPEAIMHNITYVLYGGTEWRGAFEEGREVQLAQPSREGYTFLGWYTTPDYIDGTEISRIPAAQKADITVYAKWLKNEEPKDEDPKNEEPEDDDSKNEEPKDEEPKPVNYTVTFNSAGGSAVEPQTVAKGMTAKQPAAPEKAGFVFKGWKLGNAAYNFASPVNGSITLVAQWEAVNVTVPDVKVTKITISGISKKIAAGKKIQLIADVAPKDATNPSVTWSVKADKNAKYATVNAKTGLVTTKKAGKNKTVTIIAAANDGSGQKKEYKIKLMSKAVSKITLKASMTTVKAGKKVKISAIVAPKASAKSINKTLKWESSNTNYATVSKGVVTTKKAGKNKTVKITARSTDGTNKKKTIKIKIK